MKEFLQKKFMIYEHKISVYVWKYEHMCLLVFCPDCWAFQATGKCPIKKTKIFKCMELTHKMCININPNHKNIKKNIHKPPIKEMCIKFNHKKWH